MVDSISNVYLKTTIIFQNQKEIFKSNRKNEKEKKKSYISYKAKYSKDDTMYKCSHSYRKKKANYMNYNYNTYNIQLYM